MDMASLQEFLSTPTEMGEPWPKKRKTDTSHLQWRLLERPCHADKKLLLNFPEILRDFSQNVFELEEKSNKHLSPNVRQCVPFKVCMNANLQSRLLGNISFVKKRTLENTEYNRIKYAVSEFNEKNNSSFREPECWFLHAKEKEKSIDSGTISKENEFPIVNTFLNNIVAGSLISRIDSLFTDKQEFQRSEDDPRSHEVYEMLNLSEQANVLKRFSVGENSMNQPLHLCPPISNFVKGPKSDLISMLYEHNFFVNENSNVLSSKKQTLYTTNNKYRRNKAFKHIYIPYSKNSQAVIPKLVKCVTFGSFLQDKIIYKFITGNEKNDSLLFHHSSLLTTKWMVIFNEKITNGYIIFSKETKADFIVSVTTSEKEQIRRYLELSYNETLSNNALDFSALRRVSLYYLKTNLTTSFRTLSPLNTILVTSENLSIKHPNMQMVVTMQTYIQEKNRKTFKEYSVLKHDNKPANRRLRSINFINKDGLVSKCTTCSRQLVRCGNWEDSQGNPCGFADKKLHFSPFDTFKKICLNADSEEVDNLFIDKVNFSDENNAKYSKGCAGFDQRTTSRASGTMICSNISTKLFTNCNFLLEQESKDESSLFPKDTDTNRQWQKCELNHKPSTSLNSHKLHKCFSGTDQYSRMLITPSDDHKDQSIKACHSQISLHRREKQITFAFQQISHVLQYQSSYSSSICNRLTHSTVQNEDFLCPKAALHNNRHDSEVMSVKQNSEDTDKIGNIFDKSYAGKIKQHQNFQNQNLLVYSKQDQSATSVGSTNKLIVVSNTMKQKHVEDAAEEHFSSAAKRWYTFEWKSQFDLVLEELHMFNKISKENGNDLVYRKSDICEKDPFVLNHSENMVNEDSQAIHKNKINVCISTVGTTVKQSEYEQCSYKDLVVKEPKEQEVPHEDCISSTSDEELFYLPSEGN